jgi:hypothetical protein
VVSAADPLRSLISVFYPGTATFLSSSSSFTLIRAESTPFQTHCYSNPGPPCLQPGSLTTRPQRRSRLLLLLFCSCFLCSFFTLPSFLFFCNVNSSLKCSSHPCNTVSSSLILSLSLFLQPLLLALNPFFKLSTALYHFRLSF